jgi:hypothetical protein
MSTHINEWIGAFTGSKYAERLERESMAWDDGAGEFQRELTVIIKKL